jgi:hypothetical protein
MKKVLIAGVIAVSGLANATSAQDLINEVNSRSYKLGNCSLILNYNAMWGVKQKAELNRLVAEIKNDKKALQWAIAKDKALNDRNSLSMFKSSEAACKDLGYKVM